MSLKRRRGFLRPVVFLFNPIGIENLTVLQQLGRNFLTRKHTEFCSGGMEGEHFIWGHVKTRSKRKRNYIHNC